MSNLVIEIIQHHISQGRFNERVLQLTEQYFYISQPLSQLKSGWEERANQLISCLAKNPWSKTLADNITSNFQNYRVENKLLNEKIDEMQKDIHQFNY